MAFTYDLDTDAGKVRLLIPDVESGSYVFEDTEIASFLTIEGDSVRRAAALALETIASNQALTLKVIRTLDLQTDGAKLSAALTARAKSLRDQAADDEAVEDDAFDVVEMVQGAFSFRDRVYKEMLRS